MKLGKRIVTIFLCLIISVGFLVTGADIKVQAYSTSHPNTYVNTGNQIEDLIGVAMTQVGYYGTTKTGTKYGAWFSSSMTYQPWCGLFVAWCANQAGIPTTVIKKTGSSNAYRTSGTYHYKTNYVPQRGDLVLYNPMSGGSYYWPSKNADGTYTRNSHVAIVCSYDAATGKIWVVHGNSTGDKVCYNSIDIKSDAIQSFVTPPYTSGSALPQKDYINGTYVNMRSGPATSYDKIAQYNIGTQVEILDTVENSDGEIWHKVKILADSNEGYILSDYITIVEKPEPKPEPEPQPQPVYDYINGDYVNMRIGPSTSYTKIAQYNTGTELLILDSVKNDSGEIWYKVKILCDSKEGYIISDYVTVAQKADEGAIDKTAPTGSLVLVDEISESGYTVTVSAKDETELKNVSFFTGAEESQVKTTAFKDNGDGTYTATVLTSDFNNVNSEYVTIAYGTDKAGNRAVIATVRINPYTYSPLKVSYDLNGADMEIKESTADYFKNTTISGVIPEKDGMYFAGWSTEKDKGVEYSPSQKIVLSENIVLYAVWSNFFIGDGDGDGIFNASDLAAIKLYLSDGNYKVYGGADINCDGRVDSSDLAAAKLKLALN